MWNLEKIKNNYPRWKERIYEVKPSEWLFRIFLNLWISYEKLSNEDKLKLNKKLEYTDWIRAGDIFKLDNNWRIIISRKNKKWVLENLIIQDINEETRKNFEFQKTQIKKESYEKRDFFKVETFLTKNQVNKDKIKEIIWNLEKSKIKDIKTEEIKYSNWVFYILRDDKPIFYEATNSKVITFWDEDEFITDNFLNEKDTRTIEEELEKMVNSSIDELINNLMTEKNLKNDELKTASKIEVMNNLSKVKQIIRKEKIQKWSDFLSKYCKLIWLKTIKPNEIKALWFFESHFEKNAKSWSWAKWIYQITETAKKQVMKEDKTVKSWNLHNPVYNSLICVSYLRWIEKYFLEAKDKKIWNQITKEIIKNSNNYKQVVGKYLENKDIRINEKALEKILSKIHKDPYYLNKFLVLRKYNADNSRKPWEIMEHKNYYAITILYLSEYNKKEIAEVMKQKNIT